jgi:hypothetical protein
VCNSPSLTTSTLVKRFWTHFLSTRFKMRLQGAAHGFKLIRHTTEGPSINFGWNSVRPNHLSGQISTMITFSNSLFRERDARSVLRRSTSHHRPLRAIPRTNRRLAPAKTPLLAPHPIQTDGQFACHCYFGNPSFATDRQAHKLAAPLGVKRAAACAASTSRKRNRVLPVC